MRFRFSLPLPFPLAGSPLPAAAWPGGDPPTPTPVVSQSPLAVPAVSAGTRMTPGAPARPRPGVVRAERGQLRARLCHARGEAGLPRREGQPRGARLTPSKGKVTQEAGTLLRFSPPTSLQADRGVAF